MIRSFVTFLFSMHFNCSLTNFEYSFKRPASMDSSNLKQSKTNFWILLIVQSFKLNKSFLILVYFKILILSASSWFQTTDKTTRTWIKHYYAGLNRFEHLKVNRLPSSKAGNVYQIKIIKLQFFTGFTMYNVAPQWE